MKNTLLITALLFSLKSYSQTIPAYVPSDNLVGWWPFNGNADDESGNGNHGTVNSASLTTDRFGNANSAYDFDGIDDYINCGNISEMNGQDELSFSVWVNATDNINYSRIVGKEENGNSTEGFDLQFSTASGYELRINNRNGVDAQGDGTSSINLGEWYHLTIVFNGNNSTNNEKLKLYINGVQESLNFTGNMPNLTSSNSFETWIGGVYNVPSNAPWYGKLDDIGIWNRALTECEIQELYNSQLTATPDNTVTQSGNTLTATQTGAAYQWLDCDNRDTEISGETNQSFSPGISGNYKVEITLTDGVCIKVDSSDCYSFTFLGLEDTKNNVFNVYPNPTKEIITIELKQLQKTQYTITDQLGKVIKVGDISTKNQSVNVSSLSNGIYFIKIAELTHKFVKE